MRDIILGFGAMAIGAIAIAVMLASAIHHDCAPYVPLKSTAFGYPVPIERICHFVKG